LNTPIPLNIKYIMTSRDGKLVHRVKGKTIEHLLNAMFEGFNEPINEKNFKTKSMFKYESDFVSYVYQEIGKYAKIMRLGLVQDFEEGKLTPFNLLGDHVFIEFSKYHNVKNNVLIVDFGS